jgi:hypothetical protein
MERPIASTATAISSTTNCAVLARIADRWRRSRWKSSQERRSRRDGRTMLTGFEVKKEIPVDTNARAQGNRMVRAGESLPSPST